MSHEALYDKLHARLTPFVRELMHRNYKRDADQEQELEWDGLVDIAAREIAQERENARIDRLEAKLGQAALDVTRLTAERDGARAALKILLDYMDSGVIVRSIVDDAKPDFHIRMAKFMADLQQARKALGGTGE